MQQASVFKNYLILGLSRCNNIDMFSQELPVTQEADHTTIHLDSFGKAGLDPVEVTVPPTATSEEIRDSKDELKRQAQGRCILKELCPVEGALDSTSLRHNPRLGIVIGAGLDCPREDCPNFSV